MPRQVDLDPTGKGHNPGSHTPSPTSQDGTARQERGTAPQAQGLASIWPSPPSEHVRGHATGGQKSNELPAGSACPGPGHPLTLPRRADNWAFCLVVPIVLNSLACLPQSQRRISRGISQWAGVITSCRRDLLFAARP